MEASVLIAPIRVGRLSLRQKPYCSIVADVSQNVADDILNAGGVRRCRRCVKFGIQGGGHEGVQCAMCNPQSFSFIQSKCEVRTT